MAAMSTPVANLHARGSKGKTKAAAKAARYEKKGKNAYSKGRYDVAIVAFELAHQTDPQPRFLFNIGRCHERKGDLFEAIKYIQRYVDEAEDAEGREDAEEVFAILRGKLLKSSAELKLSSEPDGAAVLLTSDARRIKGATPMTVWLEAGDWKLKVSRYGFVAHREVVPVAVGGTLDLEIELVSRDDDDDETGAEEEEEEEEEDDDDDADEDKAGAEVDPDARAPANAAWARGREVGGCCPGSPWARAPA